MMTFMELTGYMLERNPTLYAAGTGIIHEKYFLKPIILRPDFLAPHLPRPECI
jgi:hypothetical protein